MAEISEKTPEMASNQKTEPNTTPTSSGLDPKMAAVLSWVFTPVSSIIFMLMEDMKKDAFVQFHAKQSLFYFVASLIIWAIYGVLTLVSFGIASCLAPIVWIAIFGGQAYAAYKAYNGEKFKLPIIGDMAEK